MPALAFFPWITVSEPLRAGEFHLIPYAAALATGAAGDTASGIAPEHRASTDAVLEMYQRRRPVDRAAVPVVRREGQGLLDEPDDPGVAALFDLRARLAFASLAARPLAGDDHRYWNSDSLRLVVQGFTHERAGATLITSRTLFGARSTYYSQGTFSRGRPEHVQACQLPNDLDASLLIALETAAARRDNRWSRLSDAIQLFGRASTDSPDISPQSELVDVVSVFSRFATDYKAESAMRALREALPSPGPLDERHAGPKLARLVGKRAITEANTIRIRWLEDAFQLRHELAHGKVDTPRTTIWSLREHLLLGSWMIPLLVKAALRDANLYEFTPEDGFRDGAFDRLATLEPFVSPVLADGAREEADDGDEPSRGPWADTLLDLRMRFAGEQIERLWEQNRGRPGWGAVLETPLEGDGEVQAPPADDRSIEAMGGSS